MKAPIRVICDRCQESVDISGDFSRTGEAACPRCGSAIQIDLPPSDSPTVDYRSDAPISLDRPLSEGIHSRIGLGRIGHYDLIERIGRGGYSQVFLAKDLKVDRLVALKVLKASKHDEKSLERFRREAKIAAGLDHPNIVPVWAFGEDDGHYWISYKLIRGRRTLADRIGEGRCSTAEAVDIAVKLADALHYAHERGIVHRDVKPSNIMIDSQDIPHLTDFGLARRLSSNSNLSENVVLGTMNYMAPEQRMGHPELADGRADVYSLGIVLFEMLAGVVPLDMRSPPKNRSRKEIGRPLPSIRSVVPGVPRELERIIARAVQFDAADRFDDALQFRNALVRWRDANRETSTPAKNDLAKGLSSAVLAVAILAALYVASVRFFPPAGDSAIQALQDAPGDIRRPDDSKPPSLQTIAPTPSTSDSLPFIGNRSSHVVHREGCSSTRGMKEDNRQLFHDLEEAEESGYKKCEKCRP
ncbi:MAG: protein kinase [Isosphaeraceae bacterium]|nr:protein kinase [Isosphaeraceae bacterium]